MRSGSRATTFIAIAFGILMVLSIFAGALSYAAGTGASFPGATNPSLLRTPSGAIGTQAPPTHDGTGSLAYSPSPTVGGKPVSASTPSSSASATSVPNGSELQYIMQTAYPTNVPGISSIFGASQLSDWYQLKGQYSTLSLPCYGLAPGGADGESAYVAGCSGHSEPGMEFYSNLPGSGGNLTWNATLPTDRNASANQGDLYAAIWFGLTLDAPQTAWMSQCFLELQLYPDSIDAGEILSTTNWSGLAVAWQLFTTPGPSSTYGNSIEELPCFIEPLLDNGTGPTFFNMHQGDRISVTMSGFPGDPLGERVSITDLTTGGSSFIQMVTPAGPIDPAYPTETYQNALQWTPGGEWPAAFAFETAHAVNSSVPENNSFSGCSPGGPNPTASNGAVPCPSFDPASWANDTLQPWQIDVPTFFNATARQTPAEVGFTQDLGGIAYTNGSDAFGQFSYGCSNRLGSAWCSTPWYSFSCASDSFAFGATDYSGTTSDFGKYLQYNPSYYVNGLGFGVYPSTNFTVPTCGGASATVTVGSAGTGTGIAYFLSHAYSRPTSVANLSLGPYGIDAIPTAGSVFEHWVTSGGVSVQYPYDPYTTLTIGSFGTVTALFALAGSTPPVPVTVNVAGQTLVSGLTELGGSVIVNPGFDINPGPPLATVTSGGSLQLAPGIYGIEAMPPIGTNFTGWETSGGGGSVATVYYPYTWLDLTGSTSVLNLTFNYVASPESAEADAFWIGSGSVSLNGISIPTTTANSGQLVLPVGSYPLSAAASLGWSFQGWFPFTDTVQTDLSQANTVTNLEYNSDNITALFEPLATYRVNLLSGGSLLVNGAPVFSGATATVPFTGSPNGSFTETLAAEPSSGYAFVDWSATPASDVSFANPDAPETTIDVNGSVTIIATFAYEPPTVSLSISVDPTGSGSAIFNGATVSSSGTIAASEGEYVAGAIPTPGWSFAGWTTQGPVSVSAGIVTVVGSGGALVARFVRAVYDVTVVESTPGATNITLGGQSVNDGVTLHLTAGTYTVTEGLDCGFSWTAIGGFYGSSLSVSNPTLTAVMLTVTGPGTLYLIVHEPLPTCPRFRLTFEETGLPLGAVWSVAINGLALQNATPSLFVSLLNGSYSYRVASANASYRPVLPTGTVVVNGAPVTQTVLFALSTSEIEFTESGLASGTSWTVTLGGMREASTTDSIVFSEANGTYAWTAGSVSGYAVSPSSGNVTVAGQSVTVALTYTAVPPDSYAVTFREANLPSGTSWSVTVRGTTTSSTGTTLVVYEPNGTYGYTVLSSDPAWTAESSRGSVAVNGAPVTVSVTFVETVYSVTFTETGLPSGSSWAVAIGNVAEYTTGSTITYSEPNGSYSYAIYAPSGYTASPSSGTVVVHGASVTVTITLTANGSGAGGPESTLSSTDASAVARASPSADGMQGPRRI